MIHSEGQFQHLFHKEKEVKPCEYCSCIHRIVVRFRVKTEGLWNYRRTLVVYETRPVADFCVLSWWLLWSLSLPSPLCTNLWYELKYSIGEKCPDGEANEVGEHFGEIRLLDERDQQEPKQGSQVDHSDSQKPVTPHCHGTKTREKVFFLTLLELYPAD